MDHNISLILISEYKYRCLYALQTDVVLLMKDTSMSWSWSWGLTSLPPAGSRGRAPGQGGKAPWSWKLFGFWTSNVSSKIFLIRLTVADASIKYLIGSDWIMDRQSLTATSVKRRMCDIWIQLWKIARTDFRGEFRITGGGNSPPATCLE